jgi:hypothetical protein
MSKVGWWDYIMLSWTQDLIEKGKRGETIKIEDLGGIENDQSLAYRT